jgi:hypothetical protein
MTNEYLQQKLGELIYLLGEVNFNFIKNDVWEKHINNNEKFNDKQINEIKSYLEDFLFDINKISE